MIEEREDEGIVSGGGLIIFPEVIRFERVELLRVVILHSNLDLFFEVFQ